MKYLFVCVLLSIIGCTTSRVLDIENADKKLQIDEFDKNIAVKELPASAEPRLTIVAAPEKEKKAQTPIIETKKAKTTKQKKQPSLEDAEGFEGRRPIIDPFRVGERVRLKVSYFNVNAGFLDIEVLPFKEVNGKKSYHFQVRAQSNDFFSSMYTVDDRAETFMDYELMIPYNMSVDVKQTKQLRTVRSYFDWKKNKASFWEKRIRRDRPLEEKSYEWDIMPYSQNIFSAAFYMRAFDLKPGKTIAFRVADERKNMVVKGHVLGIEKVQTDAGVIECLKMKPEVQIDGIFKPIGDVFFYLTNDDRKMVVRIESKIKIGTIVAKATEIIR